MRQGKSSLNESYADIVGGESFIFGMHISPYEQGNIHNKDPVRDRKLLLHRRDINKLSALAQQKGMALVPLQLYLKGGLVKLELGVARGKKAHDKRDSIAERETRREIERRLKGGAGGGGD